MGWITNVIGEQVFEGVKLENIPGGGRQYSLGKDVKPENPLVSFSELELAYKTDSLNFGAINKSSQMIMAGGFKEFTHTKSGVVKKYKEFFENIGYIGNDITFDELLQSIFRDQMIFGNAFVEIIFNDTEDNIVDLAIIDPKKIDYAKTSDGKIVLDKNGKPIGYIIKFGNGTYAEGDPLPVRYERHIQIEANSIFVLSKRICHFKLYTVGDRFYGEGLLESSYKSVLYKKNIEKGQANSIYLKGFSPLIGYVGNERRMATPQDMKSVLEKIKDIDSTKIGVFPDWVKIEPLDMTSTDLAQSALKDMRTDQMASLSAPQALISGSGEETNRATLSDQRTLWEFTLKDIIKETMSYFKKYILKPINEYNNFGGVPDIQWGELRAENIDNTIEYIIKLLTAKSSHITEGFRLDIEDELRKLMNIKKSPEAKSKKKVISKADEKPKPEANPKIPIIKEVPNIPKK